MEQSTHTRVPLEGRTIYKQTIVNTIFSNGVPQNGTPVYMPSNPQLSTCRRVRDIQIMVSPPVQTLYYQGVQIIRQDWATYVMLNLLTAENEILLENHPISTIRVLEQAGKYIWLTRTRTYDMKPIDSNRSYYITTQGLIHNEVYCIPLILYYE